MPAKSKAQFRFFKFLEHNPKEAQKRGLTTSKAAEYTKDNKGKKRYSKLKDVLKRKDK